MTTLARWTASAIVASTITATTSPVAAQNPGTTTARPDTPVVITLEPHAGTRAAFRIRIGPDWVPFILDTGAGVSVLAPELADSVRCAPAGRVTGFRAGKPVALPRCGPVTFAVDAYLTELVAARAELEPPLGGRVALSAFAGQAVTFELAKSRLTVESEASLRERTARMRPLAMRAERLDGGASIRVFLGVEAAGDTVWVALDSGSEGPTLLSADALTRLGATLPADRPAPVELRLAGFGPVALAAARGDVAGDGVLGAELLRSVTITIDLATGRAWAARAGG